MRLTGKRQRAARRRIDIVGGLFLFCSSLAVSGCARYRQSYWIETLGEGGKPPLLRCLIVGCQKYPPLLPDDGAPYVATRERTGTTHRRALHFVLHR